jgi:hypothetical protein
VTLDGKAMSREAREYCEANGLDPGRVSVTWNAAGAITGHVDLVGPVAWPPCCCGNEGCDGGLTERLEMWGIDPAEVTSHQGTIALGEK